MKNRENSNFECYLITNITKTEIYRIKKIIFKF